MDKLRIASPYKVRDALGRYELVRELAFGHFYSVYLARAAGDERNVVIKRLRNAYPEPHARARMLREARVGLGMRVPQLVRVLELHDEPELFMVMEYVEGAPLSELLARSRGSDVVRYVVSVLLDGLRALSALHGWRDEAGTPGFLVHQAASSRHLLVGHDGVTRLIDLSNLYGRMLGAIPSAQFTLMDGELAPEQAARVALDPRCDLFIVGNVLRRVLAQSARSDLEGLQEVCDRATALRPSDRYWSAEEMAHALHFAATEANLLATPEEVARWTRKSRASLIAATATSPRVKLSLPPLAPALTQLALPSDPLPVVVSERPGMKTVIEVIELPAYEPPVRELQLPAPIEVAQRKSPLLLPLVAAGLALTMLGGVGAYAWRRPVAVAPAALPIVELVVPPTVVEPEPSEPAPSESTPSEVVAEPVLEVEPVVEADVKPARVHRHRRSREERALEPTVRRAAPQVEEDIVLHEPEVLFYDENAEPPAN